MNIEELLNENIDIKYKEFHKKICHTNYEILGIKIPIIKKITKDLLKKYSYEEIINNLNDSYYEHAMIMGIAISNSKVNFQELIKLIDSYLPKIDNWAICDIFCSELKVIKKNLDEFLYYINDLLKIDKEYYQRFAIVMLLDYYINDNYIDLVLNKMLEIKSNYYYVNMAISWCLSICLIKYFDKTLKFLNDNSDKFDKWVYNKALQKAIEAYRINDNCKIILKNMKIK